MRLPRLLLPLAAAASVAACASHATPAPASAPAPAPASAAPAPAADAAAAARVDSLADAYLAALFERQPELATFYGVPGARHDRLTDNSLAAVRAWERREDALYAELLAVNAEALGAGAEWVTYGTLRELLESSRQARVCRGELWGVTQMFGWQVSYPQLAQLQPVGSEELRRQALARFRMLPHFVDTEIANLREGLRLGYSAPRGSVRRVMAQLDGLLAVPAAESPFAAMARNDSTPEFRAAVERLVADSIDPALRRYRDFLERTYLPAARAAVAVSANPDGAACYRASVRSYTTLDLDPAQIHESGRREMARIRGEMRRIAGRSFHTSDVPALLERFRSDTQYTFHTREEMVAYAQAATDRATRAMPKAFGILPGAGVRIEPYPAFQEASAPGGEYLSPAADGSRPGIYRINTREPRRQSRVGLESTAFHETVPGHHLQGTIALERTTGHPLMRYVYNSGYAEGWGLYAERLADEMGLFSSDLDRMGLLSNEALRAARLVVDPGLHVLGWTREQAIAYMLANTAESPDGVATEVDRYIAMPGQATAYMTGSLEILRLRADARRRLGRRFDVRRFHDRVLEDGSLTLPMLREKVERWVAAGGGGAPAAVRAADGSAAGGPAARGAGAPAGAEKAP